MYVCNCRGVTEGQLHTAIVEQDLATLAEVEAATGAGGGCGCCRAEIALILNEQHVHLVDASLQPLASESAA